MSNQLVLDWDEKTVRVFAFSERGGSARPRAVAMADLPSDDVTVDTLASALEPLIAPHRSSKSTAIVIVGGGDVQFRLMRLPPAPVDELPEMVAMRAISEFPSTDEQGTIDFFPFEQKPDHPQQVLAARLASKSEATARKVCERLGLAVSHILPRGSTRAWLAMHERPACKTGSHVIVSMRGGEIDLVGTYEGAPAVVRGVRVSTSGEPESTAGFVTRELRRTQAALISEVGGAKVDAIHWIVGDEWDLHLAELASKNLDQPIDTLDVRTTEITSDADLDWPEGAAAFGALLGAAGSVASRTVALDFHAPRKKIEKESPKRTIALAAAAAVLVACGVGWLMYDRVAAIERETEDLVKRRTEIEQQVEQLQDEVNRSEHVDEWLATDVNWLDELDRLALALRPKPVSDKEFDEKSDVLLVSFDAKAQRGRNSKGGRIDLKGALRQDKALAAIETRLRDATHQVEAGVTNQGGRKSPYTHTFNTDILVVPDLEKAK